MCYNGQAKRKGKAGVSEMKKTGILRTCVLVILFLAFTLAVMNVDVQAIGPE